MSLPSDSALLVLAWWLALVTAPLAAIVLLRLLGAG